MAYDGKDYSEISTMTVHVEIIPPPGPLRPEADFSYEVKDNLTVQFTDKSKHNGYDIDDDSLIYMWNFGDGSYSTEMNPSHKYDEYKTYTVVLTVTYEDGEEVIESSKSVQITIPEPDDVLDCTL